MTRADNLVLWAVMLSPILARGAGASSQNTVALMAIMSYSVILARMFQKLEPLRTGLTRLRTRLAGGEASD